MTRAQTTTASFAPAPGTLIADANHTVVRMARKIHEMRAVDGPISRHEIIAAGFTRGDAVRYARAAVAIADIMAEAGNTGPTLTAAEAAKAYQARSPAAFQ